MKKIAGMLVVAGLILLVVPVTAMADPITDFDGDSAICKEAGYVKQYKNKYGSLNAADAGLVGETRIKNRNLVRQRIYNGEESTQDVAPNKKYVKLRGIWGLADDNESDGYFGGQIIRRGRFAVFRGLYNKTDNETYGKVFGIMKKGYFNGGIVTPDGEKCRITGLYKIDTDNKTLKMRWMTSHNAGWAVAKSISPGE